MTSRTSSLKEICRLLELIKDICGISLVWKDAAGQGYPGVGNEICRHNGDFCMRVKSLSTVSLCGINDDVLVREKAAVKGRPFLNICHAGACEYIFPLYMNGVYDGAVFCGPFSFSAGIPGLQVLRRENLRRLRVLGSALVRLIEERREADLYAALDLNAKIPSRILTVMDYLRGNPRASAEDAASHISLSVSRFVHVFKEEAGVSFSEFQLNLKMKKASDLLSGTRLPLSDIAFECGFNGQSYFSKVFREFYGISPSVYRKRFRKEGEFN